MRTGVHLIVALSMAFITACGDDGFEAPSCATGEVVVEFEMDGMFTEVAGSTGNYSFINALGEDELGMLDVSFGGDAMLSLRWPELVANGDSVEARGFVQLDATESYGNCDTDGFPGTMRMDEEGGGGSFELVGVREGGDCGNPRLGFEIVGCFRSSN